MFETLRKRLHREEQGFTLIELLVVIIILGILVAIAVPSYLSFSNRAHSSANAANLRAIVPSIEAFYSDNSTYTGMTLANLQSTYDQSIDTTQVAGSKYLIKTAAGNAYCVQSPFDGGANAYYKNGPAANIVAGTCP